MTALAPRHYTYVVRRVVELHNAGRLPNVTSVLVEPVYGYFAVISYKSGSTRIIYGNDLGLNSGASGDLAKDKSYSRYVLSENNITIAEGLTFTVPSWAAEISKRYEGVNDQKRLPEATEAVVQVGERLGYPVYVKPNSGSKGDLIYRVERGEELSEILDKYEDAKVRIILIEKAIDLPDYRLVMLDGRLISAYLRVPLTVNGDGISSIGQLIFGLQEKFDHDGRDTNLKVDDPQIHHVLKRTGYSLDSVPPKGQKLVLSDVSNLSKGGTSVDVTDDVSKRWVELARRISNIFNLRLAGIDLACADISDNESEYSIIEVNASPGLDHYASSGARQMAIVDDLYAEALNADLGR